MNHRVKDSLSKPGWNKLPRNDLTASDVSRDWPQGRDFALLTCYLQISIDFLNRKTHLTSIKKDPQRFRERTHCSHREH